MKTIFSLIAICLLAVGCEATGSRKISLETQNAILMAQTELSAANAASAPYIQAAMDKERERNELMTKALAEIKCPTCRIDIVDHKFVVLDPPVVPVTKSVPVKK